MCDDLKQGAFTDLLSVASKSFSAKGTGAFVSGSCFEPITKRSWSQPTFEHPTNDFAYIEASLSR